jgi:hypothetical protein
VHLTGTSTTNRLAGTDITTATFFEEFPDAALLAGFGLSIA